MNYCMRGVSCSLRCIVSHLIAQFNLKCIYCNKSCKACPSVLYSLHFQVSIFQFNSQQADNGSDTLCFPIHLQYLCQIFQSRIWHTHLVNMHLLEAISLSSFLLDPWLPPDLRKMLLCINCISLDRRPMVLMGYMGFWWCENRYSYM